MQTATGESVEVVYRALGNGPAIVMLPPAGSRADIWLAYQAPMLVSSGYQVVLVENRGIWPSPVPPGPYDLAVMAADTARLIFKLRLEPCHVIGASLGAMIAQELALIEPRLVRSLALLGTRCRTDYFREMLARITAARLRRTADMTEFDVLLHLALLFGSATLADDQSVADWAEVLRRFRVRGPGPAAQHEATIFDDRSGVLRDLRVPSLVMGFGGDMVTPPALCREVAGAIPGCLYTEIPDVGHYGFLEEPAAVNAVLLRFVKEHS